MKTKHQATDKNVTPHELEKLRQRLGSVPVAVDETRSAGATAADLPSELGSANGFLVA